MATTIGAEARLTEGESRIINELVRQLREVHPPRNAGHWAKWSPLAFGLVLAVFAAALNSNLNAARDDQKASNARIDSIEARSKDNTVAIDRIDRDRAARTALIDARLGMLEGRTAPIDAMLKDLGRLDTASANFAARLAQGREERISDIARIVDGMSVQKTEIALLRQELQQLRQAIEARGREPSARRGPWRWSLGEIEAAGLSAR